MRFDKLFQDTFEKVPFSQELITRQKELITNSDNIGSPDDTDREIAAMRFREKPALFSLQVIATAAAALLLFISSVIVIPLFANKDSGGDYPFIALPEDSGMDRDYGLMYPAKEDISRDQFIELTGAYLPDDRILDFTRQREKAIAYYDSDVEFQMAVSMIVYSKAESEIMTFTSSTREHPLPLGMNAEGNTEIGGHKVSLAAVHSRNIYYAYWKDNHCYVLLKIDGITQSEAECVLTWILSQD